MYNSFKFFIGFIALSLIIVACSQDELETNESSNISKISLPAETIDLHVNVENGMLKFESFDSYNEAIEYLSDSSERFFTDQARLNWEEELGFISLFQKGTDLMNQVENKELSLAEAETILNTFPNRVLTFLLNKDGNIIIGENTVSFSDTHQITLHGHDAEKMQSIKKQFTNNPNLANQNESNLTKKFSINSTLFGYKSGDKPTPGTGGGFTPINGGFTPIGGGLTPIGGGFTPVGGGAPGTPPCGDCVTHSDGNGTRHFMQDFDQVGSKKLTSRVGYTIQLDIDFSYTGGLTAYKSRYYVFSEIENKRKNWLSIWVANHQDDIVWDMGYEICTAYGEYSGGTGWTSTSGYIDYSKYLGSSPWTTTPSSGKTIVGPRLGMNVNNTSVIGLQTNVFCQK